MTLQSVVWKRLGMGVTEKFLRLGHSNLASLYTEVSLRYFCDDTSLYDGMNAMAIKAEQVIWLRSYPDCRNFDEGILKVVLRS
jgi:hypothetical protein